MDIKDIIENYSMPLSEATIDPDNHMLNGVCLFGTRESANNRSYSSKAVDSLVRLADGAKCFADHPSSRELKELSGVRPIEKWIGIFENSRRDGDKVYANLKVREAYFELLQDIATMQPKGVGLSINARVQTLQDDSGKENVMDVDILRSTDLCSSCATTSNLWESLEERIEQEQNKEKSKLIIVPGSVERQVELLLVAEGIIQDKLKNDKIRREINDVAWTANGMIERVLYDEDLSVEDKKKKVIAIFDDLSKEVKKRVKGIKEQLTHEEEFNMELTLEQLKTEHKNLVEVLYDEFKAELDVEKTKKGLEDTKTALEDLQSTITEKDTLIGEKEKEITELKDEIQTLKTKVDEQELSEKIAEKKAMISEMISKAKLPKDAVTDVFMASLMALDEYKEGEDTVTVEEQVKAHLDDRRKLCSIGSGKVIESGDEFVETSEDKKPTKEDVKEAATKLTEAIKG